MKDRFLSVLQSLKTTVSNQVSFFNNKLYKYRLRRHFKKQLQNYYDVDKYIDPIYEQKINKYWQQYNVKFDDSWHKWYSENAQINDVRYIPEDLFFSSIVPYYNDSDFVPAFEDKAYYNVWFPDVNQPKTIIKNINGYFYDNNFNYLTFNQMLNECKKYKKIIIKASVESGGGKNIQVISASNEEEMLKKLKKFSLKEKKDFVIQEFIEQHYELRKMNPSSVNTIRVMSFLHHGEVFILGMHLRIGKEGAIYDHNGIICGINNEGELANFAVNYKMGGRVPQEDLPFKLNNIEIPNFKDILDIVKNEHLKFPRFGIIAWDFTIDINGNPILIEFNLDFPGCNHHQLAEGPLFGDLTQTVLEEVFGTK